MRYDKHMLGCVFVSHMYMYSCYIQHFLYNKKNKKTKKNNNNNNVHLFEHSIIYLVN